MFFQYRWVLLIHITSSNLGSTLKPISFYPYYTNSAEYEQRQYLCLPVHYLHNESKHSPDSNAYLTSIGCWPTAPRSVGFSFRANLGTCSLCKSLKLIEYSLQNTIPSLHKIAMHV